MVHNYSWYSTITMSTEAFTSVNVPFSAIGILLNIFFVYCMVVPQQGSELLKEPLKVLLGSLVGCNIIIHSCSFLVVLNEFVFSEMFRNYYTLYVLPDLMLSIMIYTMMTIVTACHCKNMFYFCQIVRLQHSVFIWIKRNIRAFIYSALILNGIFCLFGMIVDVAYETVGVNYVLAFNASDDVIDALWSSLQINRKVRLVDFWIRLGFFFLSLCVMLASSYLTVLYLWRHMKNVEESSLISPRLQRQIKMTITGITVQALLHFLCSEGILIVEIVVKYSRMSLDWNGYILYTIISVYSFGTTINMMVSQSLFRQGAIHAWQTLLQTPQFLMSQN